MFNTIASKYDTLNRCLSLGRDLIWRKKAVKLLAGSFKQKVVVDLCGGTGDFSKAWLREHPETGSVIVGDFALNMLLNVPLKLPKVKSLQLDAMRLPFKDGTVDVALNGFGMRNLLIARVGLEEVQRVLKPGGQFVTLEFFRPEGRFSRFFYEKLAPLIIPQVGMVFARKRLAYKYLSQSVLGFLSASEYSSLAELCGFGKASTVYLDKGIAAVVVLEKL